MKSRRKKRFVIGILIGTCAGVALCLAFSFNLFSGAQLSSGDFLFKATGYSGNPIYKEKIVIVAIDNKSLDELGGFQSWPRSYHADAINSIANAEARVIVFDLLFSDPTPYDDVLAASISRAGNVILPMAYVPRPYESNDIGTSENVGDFIKPLAVLEQNALSVAHANLLPDADGVVRRLPLVINNDDIYEPALSLTAVAKYLRRPQIIEYPVENNRLLLAGRTIPLEDVNSMFINYTKGEINGSNYSTVSYVDTIRGNIDPAVFNDKIVLIGVTASALGDTYWTPKGWMMNGVEIHAEAIHTILSGDFLKQAPFSITITLIMALAILCSVMVLRFRVLWATLMAFSLGAIYFLISFSLFDRGIMLNMLYPPLAILASFLVINLFNITIERAEKAVLKDTFGRYLSRPVAEEILTALDGGAIKLGGQQCKVTVAFADVRGFTSISESMNSEDLVRVLNLYLSIIVESVQKYKGMVNKFDGDSVMAVWNAPTHCEQHALMAIKAALDAQREIRLLQEREDTLLKMDFHLGINTGTVIAGNMGSKDRLEYSVIGDPVNVAARIAGVAEVGKVWIGSATYQLVRDYITVLPLEPLTVKGKEEPIQVYEIADTAYDLADLEKKDLSENNPKKDKPAENSELGVLTSMRDTPQYLSE